MTYQEWEEKYQPKVNHLVRGAPIDDYMYETYGEELEFIKQQQSMYIWTVIDSEDMLWVVKGPHIVNRLGYIITEVPWNDEDEIEDILID